MYPEMQSYVRSLMLTHQFRVNSTEYSEMEVGETVMRMHKLPAGVYKFMELCKNDVVPHILAIVFCTAYILWAMPLLGILLLAIVIIVFTVAIARMKTCCDMSYERDAQHSKIIGGVDDVLSNMKTVVGFGNESLELDMLYEMQEEYSRHAMGTLNCALVVKFVSLPLFMLFIAALGYACFRKGNNIPEHVKVTLFILAFVVSKAAFELFSSYKDMIVDMGTIRNALSVFDECPKPATSSPSSSPRSSYVDPSVCIRLEDVSYSYPGSQRRVFDHLDMSFERGKATAVVGDIGSGKSTLISLLLGFQTPDSGHIYLDGVPYDRIEPSELRKRIFLLPQTPFLMNRSVFDNICYGVDTFREAPVTREEVVSLVASLGLGDFIERVGGLDAPAGVRGSNLSGGQRQIVWILKLFLAEPEVAVLDEPTASLDPETKATVARLVVQAMRSNHSSGRMQTVILSTHDRVLAEGADTLLSLPLPDGRGKSKA
jgi:ABC-type multidrug transport system fused ATPase/permease subunit